MRINEVIGLFAALIGSTATLLGAWAYIRSQHPPRGKLIRATFAITIIMIGILSAAVLISRATTITVNGQQTVPLPSFLAPVPAQTVTPTLTPISKPSPGSTPVPSPISTPVPAAGSTPVPSPIPASTPAPGSTPAAPLS